MQDDTHQCIQVKSEDFTNQNHLFRKRVFLRCASNNDNGIVDHYPSKFYVRIRLRHRRQLLPFGSIIKHVNITIHHLDMVDSLKERSDYRKVLEKLKLEQRYAFD